MTKRIRQVGSIVLLVFGCISFLLYSTDDLVVSAPPISTEHCESAYFKYIPVMLTDNNDIYIDTVIDGKFYTLLLDLGFNGFVSLQDDRSDRLALQKKIGVSTRYNIRGSAYSVSRYKVSRVCLGCFSWTDAIIETRPKEISIQNRFTKDGTAPKIKHDGLFGWVPFECFNLFLNIRSGEAACCSDIKTLEQQGYAVKTWACVPLLLDRGLVEFEVTTPDGTVRCCVDSGCSVSFVNKELIGKSLTESCFDSNNFVNYPFLVVGEVDLGPIVLRQIPNHLPISIPLTLGVDFLLKHQVFIDFRQKLIYLSQD